MNDKVVEVLEIAQRIGKEIDRVIPVTSDGSTFSISRAYEKAAKELGYNIGSMCRDEPRALSKVASYIAKWYNIPRSDYPKMEGVVLCDDSRDGNEATIVLFK